MGNLEEREREDEREDVETREDGYLEKAIKMASWSLGELQIFWNITSHAASDERERERRGKLVGGRRSVGNYHNNPFPTGERKSWV